MSASPPTPGAPSTPPGFGPVFPSRPHPHLARSMCPHTRGLVSLPDYSQGHWGQETGHRGQETGTVERRVRDTVDRSQGQRGQE